MSLESYILQTKYNGIHPCCKCGCGKLTKFQKNGKCDFSLFVIHHSDDSINKKRSNSFKKTCLEKYGVEHHTKRKGYKHPSPKNKQSIDSVKKRIFEVHGEQVIIDETTYVNMHTNCKFFDKDFGEWWAQPSNIINQKQGHQNRKPLKIKETCKLKYGVENPSQFPEFAEKQTKKQINCRKLTHWMTERELLCRGSFEIAVVEWLNQTKQKFDWQIRFKMPDNHCYFVDLYLPEQDLWVEVKGYKRLDGMKKWFWFHGEHPNSELWDEQKIKDLNLWTRILEIRKKQKNLFELCTEV